MLLASVTYPHSASEQVKGHHRHVGTPRDPATARLGESVYRFVPRSIVGGLISAWQIERLKLWERDKGTWSINNLMLRYAALELAIYASIGIGLGPSHSPCSWHSRLSRSPCSRRSTTSSTMACCGRSRRP